MNLKHLTKLVMGGLLVAFVGAGCMGTKVQFADAPVDRLDLTKARAITGSATGFQLLLIFPIAINGRLERAYAELKQEAHGDYITDIKIQESWAYGFVGTSYRTTLTAIAYPDKSLAPAPAAAPVVATLTQKLSELKDSHDKGQMTDAEYEAARKKAIGN